MLLKSLTLTSKAKNLHGLNPTFDVYAEPFRKVCVPFSTPMIQRNTFRKYMIILIILPQITTAKNNEKVG